MVDLSGVGRKSLVDRIKAIILSPREEWPRIAVEPTTRSDVLRGYVLPLAAIGPVASFIGGQVFGYGAFGFTYKPGVVAGLSSAIVGYALTIAGVFVLTFLVEAIAPKFDGVGDRTAAFKLVAYGATASWLVGIFGLIPSLTLFSLLGLYSLYLFFTGIGPMMKVPQEKTGPFVAVIVVSAIVLSLIVAPITAALTRLWTPDPLGVAASDVSGTVTVPGGGTVDLAKMQEATRQMEAAASGKSPPVSADRMKALLPPAIGGYQQSATEGVAMGAMGSTAQGTYTAGGKSFTLKIADMSALGALAGLGAAMGVEQSREDADSYERTRSVGGQMQTEAWNKTSGSGKYGITVNNRFLIEAEGTAAGIDELKQAVASVDQDDLADLVG